MTSTAIHNLSPIPIKTQAPVLDRSGRILRHLAALHRRLSARRELRRLNASQLRDVGIDPGTVCEGPIYATDPQTMIRLMSMR
ncbi:MAG: DUF1127 domain-containing protein [Kiloniellaceae bacterium]